MKRWAKHYKVAKRILDLLLGVPFLLLFLPLILIACVWVAIEDGFPVFFRQTRVSKGGGRFTIFKIRTMVKNADKLLRENPALLEEYRKNFKLDNDPRILKSGQFLRKTSIDELPQFFNVVIGDMSMVGPRPIVVEELQKFADNEDWYLTMKPGIAGLWQCSGRSDVGYPQVVEFDRKYYQTASIVQDLRILAKTGLVVLRRRGAG